MTITKQAAFSLLEGLTESVKKTRLVKVGAIVGDYCPEVTYNAVLIGSVLKMASVAWTEEQQKDQWAKLTALWYECDTDLSLQEILEGATWVIMPKYPDEPFLGGDEGLRNVYIQVLKDEKVEALLDLLINLQLTK